MTPLRTTSLALAIALLGLPAVPASAHGDSHYRGGCGFDTVSPQVVDPDRYTGVAYARVVVYSRGHGNVVTATVSCVLKVNGVVVPDATVSGSGAGVVAFAGRVEFTAHDTDTVNLCDVVDYTSDETPTETVCAHTTQAQMPPQDVIDTLDLTFRALNAVLWAAQPPVDPLVCPVIAALAPGVGPLTVRDGDLYLGSEWLWDCPPYDVSGGGGPPPPLTTGGGWNDGTTGSLTLTALGGPGSVTSACSFRLDGGTVTVTGATGATGATQPDAATLRCTLVDADTGTTLYDGTANATRGVVTLGDTRTVTAAALTVCTEGSATWGTQVVSTGRHCRAGRPV
jgi:hypothetical protein